jgi:hypothetical protein
VTQPTIAMNITSAKLFADVKLPSKLSVDQMVMIAYVQDKKNIVMHTGRIEQVWKYPMHYEVKVVFMPDNEISYETLYLQDFNNWESPNAWSTVRSPAVLPPKNWRYEAWLVMCIFLIGIVITAVLMRIEIIDYVIDYVRFGVM